MSEKWTKRAAIERMKSNTLLQEVLHAEPELRPILEQARRQRNVKGYNRIETYLSLRDSIQYLVGWYAHNPEIKTRLHHDAVIRTIADLLPPDQVDLYPEGVVKNEA